MILKYPVQYIHMCWRIYCYKNIRHQKTNLKLETFLAKYRTIMKTCCKNASHFHYKKTSTPCKSWLGGERLFVSPPTRIWPPPPSAPKILHENNSNWQNLNHWLFFGGESFCRDFFDSSTELPPASHINSWQHGRLQIPRRLRQPRALMSPDCEVQCDKKNMKKLHVFTSSFDTLQFLNINNL